MLEAEATPPWLANATFTAPLGANSAPTVTLDPSVKVQVACPEQAPLQPENEDPLDGAAESVTIVPCGRLDVQVAPQSIPFGSLMTAPEPEPALEIVTE